MNTWECAFCALECTEVLPITDCYIVTLVHHGHAGKVKPMNLYEAGSMAERKNMVGKHLAIEVYRLEFVCLTIGYLMKSEVGCLAMMIAAGRLNRYQKCDQITNGIWN